jgi:hypothetical protein
MRIVQIVILLSLLLTISQAQSQDCIVYRGTKADCLAEKQLELQKKEAGIRAEQERTRVREKAYEDYLQRRESEKAFIEKYSKKNK